MIEKLKKFFKYNERKEVDFYIDDIQFEQTIAQIQIWNGVWIEWIKKP